MAKILRKPHIIFGNAGTTGNFVQFGSTIGLGANATKDIPTIEGLSAWTTGWQDAVYSTNKAPFLEEMNAIMYAHSYQMGYLFQAGIPEWDSATIYFTNSVVQANGGQWFASLQDSNIGNAPPAGASNAFWKWVNAPIAVPQSVPVGTLIDHAGGPTPTGYLSCDGSFVSVASYPALYAQIGDTWGVSPFPGSVFAIPNLNRRTTIGSGGTGSGVIGSAVGSMGGEETHTLTVSEMPVHTHAYSSPSTGGNAGQGAASGSNGAATQTGGAGSDGAHNNMQPSAVVNKLIKF